MFHLVRRVNLNWVTRTYWRSSFIWFDIFGSQYARIIQKLGFNAKFKVAHSFSLSCIKPFYSKYYILFFWLFLNTCLFEYQDFKIQNIVASCDVKFPIRLEGLAYSHGAFSSVSENYLSQAFVFHISGMYVLNVSSKYFSSIFLFSIVLVFWFQTPFMIYVHVVLLLGWPS